MKPRRSLPRGSRARAVLALALVTLVALAALALGDGCRAATQVRLVIDSRVTCAELAGVAIGVARSPDLAEATVRSRFFAAQTNQCEAGRVGTLVITPGDDSSRGAVVVVATPKGKDPATCTPDDGYFGCIVARRSFSFIDHAGVDLPVVIDPDCLNVPCDAFSTCRQGSCVSSEVDCSGGECSEPGELPDGGVAVVDAPTTNEASAADGGADGADADAPVDSGTDAPVGDAGPRAVNNVACPRADGAAPFSCGPETADCCHSNGSGLCIQKGNACLWSRFLCTATEDCATGYSCCTVDVVSGASDAIQTECRPGACPYDTACRPGGTCPPGRVCEPSLFGLFVCGS